MLKGTLLTDLGAGQTYGCQAVCKTKWRAGWCLQEPWEAFSFQALSSNLVLWEEVPLIVNTRWLYKVCISVWIMQTEK